MSIFVERRHDLLVSAPESTRNRVSSRNVRKSDRTVFGQAHGGVKVTAILDELGALALTVRAR